MPRDNSIKSVLIIGSGPIIIGQACEFDYSGSQAARSLREEGVKVTLINSNPATIMTDPIVADKVYLKPLTVESIEEILEECDIDAVGFHSPSIVVTHLITGRIEHEPSLVHDANFECPATVTAADECTVVVAALSAVGAERLSGCAVCKNILHDGANLRGALLSDPRLLLHRANRRKLCAHGS